MGEALITRRGGGSQNVTGKCTLYLEPTTKTIEGSGGGYTAINIGKISSDQDAALVEFAGGGFVQAPTNSQSRSGAVFTKLNEVVTVENNTSTSNHRIYDAYMAFEDGYFKLYVKRMDSTASTSTSITAFAMYNLKG